MTINSMNDIRNYVDGSGFETVANWSAVVDRVVSVISNLEDCPDYGQDWSEFLGTLDLCELVIEADDELIAERNMDVKNCPVCRKAVNLNEIHPLSDPIPADGQFTVYHTGCANSEDCVGGGDMLTADLDDLRAWVTEVV